jgi:hypothetical protein
VEQLDGIEEGARVRVRLTSLIGRSVTWDGVVVGEVDNGYVAVRDDADGSIEHVPIARVEPLRDQSPHP